MLGGGRFGDTDGRGTVRALTKQGLERVARAGQRVQPAEQAHRVERTCAARIVAHALGHRL